MKNVMLASVAAIALAGAAFAQTTSGTSQLDAIVGGVLDRAGVEYDVASMSAEQKSEIKFLADSSDPDLTGELNAILNIDNTDAGTASIEPTDQLRSVADETLMNAGITYNAANLTAEQMTRIKFIAEDDAITEKDGELYSVIGFDNQMITDPIGDAFDVPAGTDQLRTQAYHTLMNAGIVYDVDFLTSDQLAQIKAVEDEDGNAVNRLEEIVGLQG